MKRDGLQQLAIPVPVSAGLPAGLLPRPQKAEKPGTDACEPLFLCLGRGALPAHYAGVDFSGLRLRAGAEAVPGK